MNETGKRIVELPDSRCNTSGNITLYQRRQKAHPMDDSKGDIRFCPVCGKEVDRSDMNYTRDCHGIVFRLVCYGCYEKLMRKGYDGEYYTDADEVLDEDY